MTVIVFEFNYKERWQSILEYINVSWAFESVSACRILIVLIFTQNFNRSGVMKIFTKFWRVQGHENFYKILTGLGSWKFSLNSTGPGSWKFSLNSTGPGSWKFLLNSTGPGSWNCLQNFDRSGVMKIFTQVQYTENIFPALAVSVSFFHCFLSLVFLWETGCN